MIREVPGRAGWPTVDFALPGLVSLVLVLGGCAEGSDRSSVSGSEERLTPDDPLPRWALVGEVPGTSSVGEITDFAVNERGDVVFLDALNHRITLVRPTGETKFLGGRGQGPGELVLPRAVALLDDGAVAALDLGAGRITLWGPDGSVIGTTGVPPFRVHTLDSDGVRLAALVAEGSDIASPDSAGVPLLVLRFQGLEPLEPVRLDGGVRPGGGHGGSSLSPFAMLDESRFVLVRYRGGYDITLGSLAGLDPIRIQRDVTPPPSSPEAFRRVRSRANEQFRSFARALGAPGSSRELFPETLPDSLPPMGALAEVRPFGGDSRGRIWIARGLPGPEGSQLDVFGPEGEFLGEVRLPGPTLSGIRVRGNHAVGIHFGFFDEPSLYLFRITDG